MNRPRILVAGVGNIFLGDDAFGVEVACIPERFEPAMAEPRWDMLTVLVGCVDRASGRVAMGKALKENRRFVEGKSCPRIWYLDLGNGLDFGQLALGYDEVRRLFLIQAFETGAAENARPQFGCSLSREQELERGFGAIHAPGRVEARCQAIAHVLFVQLHDVDPGDTGEGGEARPCAPSQHAEAARDEGTVLADKGAGVADRADRHEIKEAL